MWSHPHFLQWPEHEQGQEDVDQCWAQMDAEEGVSAVLMREDKAAAGVEVGVKVRTCP